MSYVNAAKLSVQHGEWLKTLAFYQDEIEIMKTRLLEIAAKNSSNKVNPSVEHFQNQFIVQRNNIDELKHAVNEHAHHAFEDAQVHEGRIDKKLFGQHMEIEDQVKQFEKVVNELRHEFNLCIAKWM